MADLVQIRFEYKPAEDRLLLCVTRKGGDTAPMESCCWITRRFVRIFVKAIDRLIADELAGDIRLSPDALEQVKQFQQEAALARADISTSSDAMTPGLTDGMTPLLCSILKITRKSRGKYTLSLLDHKDIGIHLTTGMDLIYTLRKMLLDAAGHAGWHTPLLPSADEESQPIQPARYRS